MPQFEVRLFGVPEFRYDGAPWPLKSALRRCIELLALCIAHAGKPLSRESICGHLWPDAPREEALANLRRHLSRLAAALPPEGKAALKIERLFLRWAAGDDVVADVAEFERLSSDAAEYDRAIARYGGDFLAGIDEDWVIPLRERYRTSVVQMSQTLGVLALRNRDFLAARAHGERALELGDWREDSLRVLMTALYALGDRTGALAAYERFADALEAEMQVSAMPETIALRDAIAADIPLPETLEDVPTAPPHEDEHPMVGRDGELTQLRSAWDRAARGAGNTIFVGGEAGIGKSRLMRALAQVVDEAGGRALWGHASPDSTAAYQPLTDVIKAGLPAIARDDIDDVWLASVAGVVPEVARLRPAASALAEIDADRGAQRLREAFTRTIEAIARRRPTLIVIEDLHWADSDTLDAVAYLARRVRGSHVLLALTHRSEETPLAHPLREMRRTLLGEHRASTLALSSLAPDAVRRLVAHAVADVPDSVAEGLTRASGGNPLFLTQLLRSLAEQGVGAAEASYASGMDELIERRLERLAPEARAALDVGALIDERFTLEELAATLRADEAAVSESVDKLLDGRYLRWTSLPGFSLTFSHQLLRDAVVRRIPGRGREALHRRIAAVLQQTRSGDASAVPTIARHFELGGQGVEAFGLYLRAAEAAAAVYAPTSSLEMASLALRAAPTERERFAALRLACAAHHVIGSVTPAYEGDIDALLASSTKLGADERFEAILAQSAYLHRLTVHERLDPVMAELERLARESNDPSKLLRAHEQKGYMYFMRGQLREAIAAFDEALQQAAIDTISAFKIRSQRTSCYLRSGDRERAVAEFATLETLAAQIDDPRTDVLLGIAQQNLAIVMEDHAMFEAAGRRLLSGAERTGELSPMSVGLGCLAHAAYQRGDIVEGRERTRRQAEFMEQHGIVLNLVTMRMNFAVVERELGNIDEAIELWEDGLAHCERSKQQSGIAVCLINIGEALVSRGEWQKALPLLRRAYAVTVASGERRLHVDALAALGWAQHLAGQRSAGLLNLYEAVEERRRNQSWRLLANDLCTLIECLLSQGSHDEAGQRAEELRAIYARGRDKVLYAPRVCLTLAKVAESLGDDMLGRRYRFEGETIAKELLAKIPDEHTRENYAAMSFNRELLRKTVGIP